MSSLSWVVVVTSLFTTTTAAFDIRTLRSVVRISSAVRTAPVVSVVSPFDTSQGSQAATPGAGPVLGPLPLTEENVELVLDEMRPYPMADGGNVALRDIDGATVHTSLCARMCGVREGKCVCSFAAHKGARPVTSRSRTMQVILELQGSCGSCPSSSMTMK